MAKLNKVFVLNCQNVVREGKNIIPSNRISHVLKNVSTTVTIVSCCSFVNFEQFIVACRLNSETVIPFDLERSRISSTGNRFVFFFFL
eukprot:UN03913